MSITLEINLRVPDISIRSTQEPPRRITNSDSRFWKVVDLSALPKVGETLELSSRTRTFQATVKRLDWHDDKNRFVAFCHYLKRSMTPEEYESLRTDPDWTMRPLSGN